MNYLRLGTSGLQVSRLCLGCMTYGDPARGNHTWTLGEAESRPFVRRALDLGITFFDTANAYSDGTSEEIVGKALLDYAKRDEIVLATKGYHAWGTKPNTGGLSRKALFAAVDDSLRRLGTDYVDLYQIHRWDYHTPIAETLEALHDIVKSGRVRYLGASSMFAWQFAKALHLSDRRGWSRFVSMQPHYNLLYREEEREMFGLCKDEGIGVLPWSPLARGKLARPWSEEPTTARSGADVYGRSLYEKTAAADRAIVDLLAEIAKKRGLPQSQVALAWVLHQPVVTSPILGASKPHHLDDAVAALSVTLAPEEIAALEAPYIPHPVAGHF